MRRVLVLLFLVSMVAAQAMNEVEITSEPSHHLALENEYLRVFKVKVAPHAATLLHRHRHDYIFITIGDARVQNAVEGEAPVEIQLTDGDARFTPGNFAHIAKDLGDQPFRNVTIELLQDEKARAAPSPWPEDSGEKSFPGAHSKILFVKDGVRVSEVDLEAGATIPKHHHDRPHLLVAITDLDLRSDIEGKGSVPEKFKPGDIKWLPGDLTHSLTNTGKQPIRLVTVEF